VTASDRSTPAKSDSGAKIGMERTASPDDDGTKKLIPTWIQ